VQELLAVPNQLLGDKNTSRGKVRQDVEHLKSDIGGYAEGPAEQGRVDALQRLGDWVATGLADREGQWQGWCPNRGAEHEVGHTQSLDQLHTATRNMQGQLVRGRAETVGSALELVHLGRGQLGEQIRRNPDTLPQVRILRGRLDRLTLTLKRLGGPRPHPPSDQNLGLQGVNPKSVLGTKVTKNIQKLL